MIPMSHLFVQCEQIKFRPMKNVNMKVSYSVVAVGIVAGGRGGGRDVGGGGGEGRNLCHVTHGINFCNFFNLLNFTIPNRRVGRKILRNTQLSSRSHPRHLVGKRTAQKDITIDTTSDSQVNSNFPNRWSPASLTFNNYFYLFLYLYIT